MQPTIHIQHYPEKHAFNLSQSPCHLASSMQRLHHVERSRYRSRCHWLAHRGENPVVPPVPQAAGRRCRFFDVFATQKGPSTLLRLPTMYDICFIEILQLYIFTYINCLSIDCIYWSLFLTYYRSVMSLKRQPRGSCTRGIRRSARAARPNQARTRSRRGHWETRESKEKGESKKANEKN